VDRELNVLTVNPKLVELVGAESAEELVGHNFKEFPLYQVESARSALEQCMNHGLSRAGEISYVSRWGNTMELRFSCLPTRDADGEISGALILCQDMGERRSLEAQLRQAQKMEAVGQLAGGIAHDFNNYLTVIMGSAHELAELYSDDEQAKSVVEEIAVAAQRSASLTRQLLAFSRKQVLQPRLVDLNELITDLERMLRRVLGGNVALETRLASDLGTARVDPSQIEQVIVNLALNARDAMPEGGTLKIETGNLQLDREAVSRHPGIEPGSYVCLRVIDDGTGIDPELRDRIFEPFFTTKKEGQGTGLGLATVYGIVEQSGGTIAVDSELEKGTTFRIYLPRAVDAEGAFSQPERRAEIVGGTETVLLVEDDRMVRSRMENTLEANGYRVLSAENGEKALETARRAHPTSIQLLLTDVMMPGVGGIELAAQLRQARPGLRVLFISGYAQDGIGEGALDERTRLLQKPFTSRDLLMAVRGALEAPSLETP
ncbi:MAG: ATP-binding protein, partial [Proteobacteria bacterium]|nr:ATP-binding protein [Pseudomonadota bacterium]